MLNFIKSLFLQNYTTIDDLNHVRDVYETIIEELQKQIEKDNKQKLAIVTLAFEQASDNDLWFETEDVEKANLQVALIQLHNLINDIKKRT
jgi:hypothetical protein